MIIESSLCTAGSVSIRMKAHLCMCVCVHIEVYIILYEMQPIYAKENARKSLMEKNIQ